MTGSGTVDRDAKAFEALLEPVLPIAYGVAARLCRNSTDAEDIVQEAALLAYRAFHSFEPGTNFKAWYMRILTNCFYGRYRKAKRAPALVDLEDPQALHLLWNTASSGVAAHVEDPAAAVIERLDSEQVATAIAALPEEFRVVCALYFVDDLPYQEIAEICAIPLGTVRSRLHRGRRMLQKALWHVAESHGIVATLAAGKD